MGYVSKKKKVIIVLCRIHHRGGGGGGVEALLKMGLRGILVSLSNFQLCGHCKFVFNNVVNKLLMSLWKFLEVICS